MTGITLLRKRPRLALLDDEEITHEIKHLHQKFLKKSAKGRVLKVVQEHYLRSDIPCGSLVCAFCDELYQASLPPSLATESEGVDTVYHTTKRYRGSEAVLSLEGRPALDSKGKRHYLVLDTNVVLHQMDLLESPSFGNDLVILQTVVDEVKHKSLPLFNRLNALIADESRRVWTFANEACLYTHVSREQGETPNDRNDRAIRNAAMWYNQHIEASSAIVGIILLSDDLKNRQAAKTEELVTFSVKEYVEKLPTETSTLLLDLIAVGGILENDSLAEANKKRQILYQEYLSTTDLLAGVQSGQLHQGNFNPNPYNYLEGNVNVPTFDKPILLIGRENMNRAVAGDVVVVETFAKSEWKAPTDEVIEQDAALKSDDPDESDEEERIDTIADTEAKLERRERLAAKIKSKNAIQLQPTGRILGVVRRGWRSYVCHLDRSSLSPSALESLMPLNVFAVPLDRKIPKIRIRTRQVKTLVDQKFVVAIDRWDVTSRYPEGHFVRSLGKVESKEAEIESLLLEWDVPYRPFSQAVLDCLPTAGDTWKVPPKSDTDGTWRGREDLRDLTICSIDPPGCQDIDDALHAKMLPNGNIEAGVHIADVSYFVHPDNPMDTEAASRGTTVYLVDKRIDMLPPLLGTNLCSLRPFVERLAFSVFWELDQNAEVVNVRFTKAVIASKAAFTYEEAQLRKDDKSLHDDLTKGIRLLNSIAIKLKAKRMAAGALNLASPEVKIQMDSAETSGPIDVEQKKLLETNSLVEEFMLLANITVAAKIYESFPQTAVLRRHCPPPASNFDVLKDVLAKRRNLSLDVSSSGALAKSLDECIDPNLASFNTLVRIMATRCMLSAEYFSSGSVARDTFGHYGLAMPLYTHFTSPIRRYADVLVHRQLYAAISNTPLHAALHSKPFVEKIMANINKRHRSAQQAGRASVEFYVALALRGREEQYAKLGKGKIREEAFVIRAFRNGLAVFVSSLGLEGLITFKRENHYDADTYEISVPTNPADSTGPQVKIGVFEKVIVEISVEKDRNTQRGKVQMSLVEPINSKVL